MWNCISLLSICQYLQFVMTKNVVWSGDSQTVVSVSVTDFFLIFPVFLHCCNRFVNFPFFFSLHFVSGKQVMWSVFHSGGLFYGKLKKHSVIFIWQIGWTQSFSTINFHFHGVISFKKLRIWWHDFILGGKIVTRFSFSKLEDSWKTVKL